MDILLFIESDQDALHPQCNPRRDYPRRTSMSRITIPLADQTPSASLPLLEAVNRQLGVVPNLMKVVGNSPAALEGYLSLNGALGKSTVGAKTSERIALAVAELNGCGYCLSAHSYLGSNLAK